jgi:hypothetical protein
MNAAPDRRAVLGAAPKQAPAFIRTSLKVADAA